MAKKTLKKKVKASKSKAGLGQLTDPVVNSARDIWRAGLGAFALAQQEGSKVAGQGAAIFENLVKEGTKLESEGRKAVETRSDTVSKKVKARRGKIEGTIDAARELAKEFPDKVRQVISLGSPFGRGRMGASIPARLFTALNPPADLPVDQDVIHFPPPVPTTAIYSKGDGIVHWRTTLHEEPHPRTQSIQVFGSHCGMTLNPLIWFLSAERLAVPAGEWRPFERLQWRRLFYPSSQP